MKTNNLDRVISNALRLEREIILWGMKLIDDGVSIETLPDFSCMPIWKKYEETKKK